MTAASRGLTLEIHGARESINAPIDPAEFPGRIVCSRRVRRSRGRLV